MELIEGEMDSVSFSAFRCNQCKEELLDMDQLKELGRKHKAHRQLSV